jgi:hypothetical protein
MVEVTLSPSLLDMTRTLALGALLLAIRAFERSVLVRRMHILQKTSMNSERKRCGAEGKLRYAWVDVREQFGKAFGRRAVTCGGSNSTNTRGSARASRACHGWAKRRHWVKKAKDSGPGTAGPPTGERPLNKTHVFLAQSGLLNASEAL